MLQPWQDIGISVVPLGNKISSFRIQKSLLMWKQFKGNPLSKLLYFNKMREKIKIAISVGLS